MAQFPGLMLWTGAWVADTAHLTRLERGTYMDLIVLMWRTPGCRVPNDDAWLARHMRMTAEEVSQELRPIIKEFCQTDGNWLFQKRLQIEFVRAFKRSHGASVRAKHRWDNKKKFTSAMQDTQCTYLRSKRESYTGSAREEAEPEEAAEKKARQQVSAELYQLVAKRTAGEE